MLPTPVRQPDRSVVPTDQVTLQVTSTRTGLPPVATPPRVSLTTTLDTEIPPPVPPHSTRPTPPRPG